MYSNAGILSRAGSTEESNPAEISVRGSLTVKTKVTEARHWLAACTGMVLVAPLPVHAQQEATEPRRIERVDVTGSNIKRTDIETALPIQTITRDEIERSGVTTVGELLTRVSANLIGFNDALSFSFGGQPGYTSANLRGLGDGSTLVLIDGRRSANYAFNGGAVDLASIPLPAVERVEILKDGASAIYGADAMAGVINFILRKDFAGAQITAYASDTQHGGANGTQVTGTLGYGDLGVDRFNVFVTIDWQKEDALAARDRSFARTGYLPGEGVNGLSPVTFPANIVAPSGTLLNPSSSIGCAPPASLLITFDTTPACGFDVSSVIDILPPVERTSVFTGATYQINANHQLFVRYLYSRNTFSFAVSPSLAADYATFNGEPVFYPSGGPFYPTAFAVANGLSGDLNVYFRTVSVGPRADNVTTKAQNVVAVCVNVT